jgi:ribosome-associated heat shock protein Hsp15
MKNPENIRIDKFLWAVRIYKTRSQAAEECRKGRVLINNNPVKSSHSVQAGSIITVRKLPVSHTFEVRKTSDKRMAAKDVHEYILDLTTAQEKEKALLARNSGFIYRQKGLGRPTKKERREIDKFSGDFSR